MPVGPSIRPPFSAGREVKGCVSCPARTFTPNLNAKERFLYLKVFSAFRHAPIPSHRRRRKGCPAAPPLAYPPMHTYQSIRCHRRVYGVVHPCSPALGLSQPSLLTFPPLPFPALWINFVRPYFCRAARLINLPWPHLASRLRNPRRRDPPAARRLAAPVPRLPRMEVQARRLPRRRPRTRRPGCPLRAAPYPRQIPTSRRTCDAPR